MRKTSAAQALVRTTLAAVFAAFTLHASADTLQLQDKAPDRYVVVKGDTLWDISGKFLKKPWRWPEIWNLNRADIKNPDLIYPGDVIVLDRSGAKPRLRLLKTQKLDTAGKVVVKLEPGVRSSLHSEAIPTLPPSAIEPFLSQPLVIEENGLNKNPVIVATDEKHVILGNGDNAYVDDIPEGSPTEWQVYRQGKNLIDPETGKSLGYEAVYLGDARVTRYGNPASIEITSVKLEINKGDHLMPAVHDLSTFGYVPHAPADELNGKIVSVYGSVSDIGQYNIITLNRGSDEGVDKGTVVAIYRQGQKVGNLTTPEERSGLAMVFRVFNKVSYALVLNATRAMSVGDSFHNP